MRSALETSLGCTTHAITTWDGAVDENAWSQVEEYAKEFDCWDFADVNMHFSTSDGGFDFDSCVLRSLWFSLAEATDPNSSTSDLGLNVATAIGIRRTGLLLEEAYSISGQVSSAVAYYPRIADHLPHYRTDSFLAALRIAREIASCSNIWSEGSRANVRIANKSSRLFRDLIQGSYTDDPAIVLVAADEAEDTADFKAMVEHNRENPIRLIFFGTSARVMAAVGQVSHMQPIDLALNVNALGLFQGAVRDAIWTPEDSLDWHPQSEETSPLPQQPTPTSAGDLVQAWILGHPNGIHATLAPLLGNAKYKAIAEGALVLLHLAETRRVGDPKDDGRERVIAAYTSTLSLQRHPAVKRTASQLAGAAVVNRASVLAPVVPAFDPWCSDSLAESRTQAIRALYGKVTVEAVATVLLDALTLVAVGEALNPSAVEWEQIPRAIAPAVKSSLSGSAGVPDWLRIATPAALSIVDAGIKARDSDTREPIFSRTERWDLARDIATLEECVNCDRGMLAFQVVFRLLKSHWTCTLERQTDPVPDIFNLGRLEALCSTAGSSEAAPPDARASDTAVAQLIRQVSEPFATAVATLPNLRADGLNALMAFDVLFTYREKKRRSRFVPDDIPLWVAGCQVGWDDAAVRAREDQHPSGEEDVYSVLRQRFTLVQDHTPVALKRERLPEDSFEEDSCGQ